MSAAKKRSGLSATVLITAFSAAPLLIAPPVIRGLAALAWVNHYASVGSFSPPRRAMARDLVSKTDLAIQNLAPLPQASAAAISTLDVAQRLENQDHDREAALLIYRGVRLACARVRDRPFSGAGFAVIEARAASLEDAARRTAAK